MFTPQRWSGWSRTPRTGAEKTGTKSGSGNGIAGKGKGASLFEPTTPASGSLLLENGGRMLVGSGEAVSDGEGLARRLSELENELYEYQYNMGLLLLEKKEWTSRHEELRQSLAEAKDAVRREQGAELIAISEIEKREENLRKALGVEKQCVLDLEKALREIRSENAELKFTADSKLAEANALVASIEEKSLELEARLRAADAKLAEVSRKSSEIERKSKDLEARESALRRDRLSFNSEQEAHETSLSKRREDLLEWERKLQEGEDRLAKGQRILNQREDRANENDRIFKQKDKDLEDAQKKIDATNEILKKKEDDISMRLANLTNKEKEYDTMRMNLEMKEEELLALEEKLNERERVEIQKLIDEHNAILDAKKCEFELEVDQKRKSLDDELRNREADVEKKGSEVNHMEEKVAKREQALEKRWEKFREKESDFESKMKSLKEKEKSIKSEEKKLESEKKQLIAEKEDLVRLLAGLEKTRADNEELVQRISEERDRLKVSEEERSEYQRLQSELKQEIDKYRKQKELLLKEAEDLKQQKEQFEREWEELDDKRAEIEKDLKNVSEQKEEVEKWKHTEEERLKNEKVVAQDYIKREQDDLKLARESFEAHMEHEKSVLAENAQSERSQMLHEYETRKRELEFDMQNRLEETEKLLRERERSFAEERERELDNVSNLREVARREMEEINFERLKIEKERQEADANKEDLERQQVEIRKDIDALNDLSQKLRDHRKQFIKERESFVSFIEKLKNCTNCGEMISEFVLSNLRPLAEIDNAEIIPLPRLGDDYLKGGSDENLAASERQNNENLSLGVDSRSPVSGGMSWLRKCTSKIFNLSPVKKFEFGAQNLAKDAPFSGEHNVESSKRVCGIENEAELSFDVQRIQSDNSIREVEAVQYTSADEHSNMNTGAPHVPEDSQPSYLKGKSPKPSRRGRRGRPAVNRTRSVKAAVKDAKAFMGEDFETHDSEYANGTAQDSVDMHTESQGGSSLANKGTARNGRKRGRVQTSQTAVSGGNDSEGRSDSVIGARPKKRRENVLPAEQAPGGSRYNLRRPKIGVTVAAVSASGEVVRENEEEVDGARGTGAGIHYSKAAPATSVGVTSENGGSTQFERCGTLEDSEHATKNLEEEDRAISEEVNGSTEGGQDQEYVDGDEYRSESQDATPIEEDEEDEESERPGEASIGKKLWTFLTT